MCPETSRTSHWGHGRSKSAPRARGTAGLPLESLASGGEGRAVGDAFRKPLSAPLAVSHTRRQGPRACVPSGLGVVSTVSRRGP